jgi:hypothetical protein
MTNFTSWAESTRAELEELEVGAGKEGDWRSPSDALEECTAGDLAESVDERSTREADAEWCGCSSADTRTVRLPLTGTSDMSSERACAVSNGAEGEWCTLGVVSKSVSRWVTSGRWGGAACEATVPTGSSA